MATTQTPTKSPTFLRKPGVEKITQLNPYSSAFIDTLDLSHFSTRKLTDPEPKATEIGWPEVSKNLSGVITNSVPIPASFFRLRSNVSSFRAVPITKMFPSPPTPVQKYLAATLNVPDIGYGWTGMRGATCYIRESSTSGFDNKYSTVRQMMDSFINEPPDTLLFKSTTDSGYFAGQDMWCKVPVMTNLVNVYEVEPGRQGGMCIYTFAVKGVYEPQEMDGISNINPADKFFQVYKLAHFVVCEDLLDHALNQLVFCPPYFYLYGFMQMYSKLILEKYNFKITAAGRIQISAKNSGFIWKDDDLRIQRFASRVLTSAGLLSDGLLNGSGPTRSGLLEVFSGLPNVDWSLFGAEARMEAGYWKWIYSSPPPGATQKSPTQLVADGILAMVNSALPPRASVGWSLVSGSSSTDIRNFFEIRHTQEVRNILESQITDVGMDMFPDHFFADRLAKGVGDDASTSLGLSNLPYLSLLTPVTQQAATEEEQTDNLVPL